MSARSPGPTARRSPLAWAAMACGTTQTVRQNLLPRLRVLGRRPGAQLPRAPEGEDLEEANDGVVDLKPELVEGGWVEPDVPPSTY